MDTEKFLADYMRSEFRVEKDHEGMRADAFLALQADFLSRTRLKRKIQNGESLLNGRNHSASKRIRQGDIFSVTWRKTDDRTPPPEPEIVYEDEYMLGVNKPAGTAVHPTGRKQSGTLIQGMFEYFREEIECSLKQEDREDFYPRLINRLDLFTSGVVLVAKRKDYFVAAQKLLVRKEIEKQYTVIAEGKIEPAESILDFPIGPDEESEIYMKQCVREDGQESATRYRVIEYIDGNTLLHAWPETGRQHQIRVHFAHIGNPVLGDLIYRDESLFFEYYKNGCSTDGLPQRQALHAESVTFRHPYTGKRVTVTAPIPHDVYSIIDEMR